MSIVARPESFDEPKPVRSRIPFALAEISPEAREAVSRVLASGWVTTGPEVSAFERDFAEVVGARYAVAVASCTVAIELSLRALGLPPGSKVLTSDMTFCGAIHAIVHAGLRPVLADVNTDTLMPDPETTAEAVQGAGGVDAMVVLHFAGQPAPVEDLADAARLGLDRVVEDAAHALGTWVGDRMVGTLSAATCFSFYATKNLPVGEGGMITTDQEPVAEYVRRARLHGMSRDAWKRYLPGSGWRYEVEMAGLKANMTDVQAAIGRAQLRHLPEWQSRREELARRYAFGLAGIAGFRAAAWPDTGRHAWHLYVARVEPSFGVDRDTLIGRLSEGGVDCSVHFIPAHHQPYFRQLLGEPDGHFPRAEHVFSQILSLPLYPLLSNEDVDRVCEDIAREARPPGSTMEGIRSSRASEESRAWGIRSLIVGGGDDARRILGELRPFAGLGLQPIGIIDDHRRRRVAGLPILGQRSDLAVVVDAYDVGLVIIADPSLPAKEIRRLGQVASSSGASVRYLPSTTSGGNRVGGIGDLRSLANAPSGTRRIQ